MFEVAASFDRTAPVKGKGAKKPKKAVAAPDMKPMEILLYERTVQALRSWGTANPKAELALLGFDGAPPHDNVGICFGSASAFGTTIASLASDAAARRKALDYKHWDIAHRQSHGSSAST